MTPEATKRLQRQSARQYEEARMLLLIALHSRLLGRDHAEALSSRATQLPLDLRSPLGVPPRPEEEGE